MNDRTYDDLESTYRLLLVNHKQTLKELNHARKVLKAIRPQGEYDSVNRDLSLCLDKLSSIFSARWHNRLVWLFTGVPK